MDRRLFLAGSVSSLITSAASARNGPPPASIFRDGFADTSGRLIATPHGRCISLLVFGQSNATSIAPIQGEKYLPKLGALNFNPADSKIYHAIDPLLGPQTAGGDIGYRHGYSWSTRLASKLVESRAFDSAIICNISVGATVISDWTHGGVLSGRVTDALRKMSEASVEPDAVLLMQGESDALEGTKSDAYSRSVKSLVEEMREASEAPLYISQTSLVKGAGEAAREQVREGQRLACSVSRGIYLGPDSDLLHGPEYRFDGTHFNENGLSSHADQWFDQLTRR